MKKLLLILSFIFVWSAFSQDLFACKCTPDAFKQSSENADLVFVGTAMSLTKGESEDRVYFSIREIKKGTADLPNTPAGRAIPLSSNKSSCGLAESFEEGTTYEVAAKFEKTETSKKWTSSACAIRKIQKSESMPSTLPKNAADKHLIQNLCQKSCSGHFARVEIYQSPQKPDLYSYQGDIHTCSHPPLIFYDAEGKEQLAIPERPYEPTDHEINDLRMKKDKLLKGYQKTKSVYCEEYLK